MQELLTSTPWGPALLVKLIAPGIFFISTATHGGYYLAPEINDTVMPEIKQMTFEEQGFQGFYEEDEDASYIQEVVDEVVNAYLQ